MWNYRQHYYAYEPNFWLGTVNGQVINKRFMLEDGGTVRPMVHDVYMDKAPLNLRWAAAATDAI